MEQHLTTGALLREVGRLHTHLQRASVACCAGTTVTQCTVLTELGRSGPIPLATLARRIGFDKSWTSRAVEHLVQDGLVEKVPSQTDHRMVRLSLTLLLAALQAEVEHPSPPEETPGELTVRALEGADRCTCD